MEKISIRIIYCQQCNIIMGKRKSDVACSSSQPKGKLTKLAAFGFNANSSDNTVTEPAVIPGSPTSSTCGDASSATPHHDERVKTSRKFLQSWKLGRPWLRYDTNLKQMFCDICIKGQVVNSFTTGCDILKKECVTKHESRRGDNSHTYALTVMRDAKSMEIAKITALSKSKNAIISAMRNTFFVAYYNLANTIVPKLHKLCITQVLRISMYRCEELYFETAFNKWAALKSRRIM